MSVHLRHGYLLYEAECGPDVNEYVVTKWHGEVLIHFAIESGTPVARNTLIGEFVDNLNQNGHPWHLDHDWDTTPLTFAHEAGIIDDNTFSLITSTPIIGVGATYVIGSDSYAGTVVRISKSGTTFWMQLDHARLVGGDILSESQQYTYERDEQAPIRAVRWSKKHGRWMSYGAYVGLGYRRTYRDPSF